MDTVDTPSDQALSLLWASARDAYLAGETIERVCATHGLARTTFTDRAKREGWRRVDRPPPEPIDPNEPDPDLAALGHLARIHLGRAVSGGRVMEAQRWLRLINDLDQRISADASAARHQAFLADCDARDRVREAERAAAAPPPVDRPAQTARPAATSVAEDPQDVEARVAAAVARLSAARHELDDEADPDDPDDPDSFFRESGPHPDDYARAMTHVRRAMDAVGVSRAAGPLSDTRDPP